jgi:hypothetical protein
MTAVVSGVLTAAGPVLDPLIVTAATSLIALIISQLGPEAGAAKVAEMLQSEQALAVAQADALARAKFSP